MTGGQIPGGQTLDSWGGGGWAPRARRVNSVPRQKIYGLSGDSEIKGLCSWKEEGWKQMIGLVTTFQC